MSPKKLWKWQIAYLEKINSMSNQELLLELFFELSEFEYHSAREDWMFEVAQDELKKRLIKIGFIKE